MATERSVLKCQALGRQKTPVGSHIGGRAVSGRPAISYSGKAYGAGPGTPKPGNHHAKALDVRIGRLTLILFVVLQVADGLITFGAVRIFGTAAEGNPILETWIQLAGPGAALLGAKGVACGGAVLLYALDRRRTLAALTGVLLAYGVLPWLVQLATFR